MSRSVREMLQAWEGVKVEKDCKKMRDVVPQLVDNLEGMEL